MTLNSSLTDPKARKNPGRYLSRAGLLGLAFWLVATSSFAAEPFGADEYHPTYSDRGWVTYELTRAALDTASTCNTNFSLDHRKCYTGIHRFCRDNGYESGYGFESASDPTKVDIKCMGPEAVEFKQAVPHADVTGASAPNTCKTYTDLENPALGCSVAVDRYCRSLPGRIGGFGPVELGTTHLAVGCIKDSVGSTHGGIDMNTQPSLLSCTNIAATEAPCRQAMDDYCVSLDPEFRGGFGPAELLNNTSNQIMRIVCVDKQIPWEPNSALPSPPSHPVDILDRNLDTQNIGNYLGPNHNELFGYRGMSFDGRVILRKATVAGQPAVSFQLQTPEIFESPLSQQPVAKKDQSTASGLYSLNVPTTKFFIEDPDPNVGSSGGVLDVGSTVLCDPHNPTDLTTPPLSGSDTTNSQQSVPARTSNPYACTLSGIASNSGDYDCYDLTVLSVYKKNSLTAVDDLWSKAVKVIVKNPKKSVPNGFPKDWSRAHIVAVDDSATPVKKSTTSWVKFLEPVMTGDGRLLVAHIDDHIQYSTIDGDACDINAMADFKHIWQMHGDSAMQSYGLAKYPLRDTEGNVLGPNTPDGAQLRGAYPWMDRDGDNLIYGAGRGSLYYIEQMGEGLQMTETVKTLYPVVGHPTGGQSTGDPGVPLIPSVQDLKDNTDQDQGNVDILPRLAGTVVGLWTHGKLVTPDMRNNSADMGIPGGPAFHRLLNLYENTQTEVGAAARTKIASPENQFFMLPNLRPDTPREVIWTLTSQRQTDEFAFDDVIDPDALIVSTMGTSIQNTGPLSGKFKNGFIAHQPLAKFIGEGFKEPSHIANQATSVSEAVAASASTNLDANVRWNVPAYGLLLGGARAEPIAAGGFDGRGLWLDVNDRLEYLIPEQPVSTQNDFDQSTWFVHVSVDPRDLSERQRLLSMPDGSWLDIFNSSTLIYGIKKVGAGQINLPAELNLATNNWTSLAVVSSLEGGGTLRFYIDGYLFAEDVTGQELFRPGTGIVRLGAIESGFTGWVDDFKVIGREPNPEVICNHARGTMVRVPNDAQAAHPLYDQASAYPATVHTDLRSSFLPASAPGNEIYACERPIQNPVDIYAADDHANYRCLGKTRRPATWPNPTECLRETLILSPVHTPVYWDVARPDHTQVPFCTSCHVGSNPSTTMDVLTALSAGTGPAKDDKRRQPMDVPPEIFGVVPNLYFGLEPAMTFRTPQSGEPLDPFVSPASPPTP